MKIKNHDLKIINCHSIVSSAVPFLLTLFVAAIARGLDFNAVLTPLGISLVGGPDAYYHLRRAELAAGGHLSGNDQWDQWISFPLGDHVHWPLGYDWIIGGIYRIAGLKSVLFVPLILGILAVAALKPWAESLLGGQDHPGNGARHFRNGAGFADYALIVYALAPAAVYPTAFGALDHHCLEGFLFVIVLRGAVLGTPRAYFISLLAVGAGAATITAWPILAVTPVVAEAVKRGGPKAAALAVILGALAIPIAGWSYFTTPFLIPIDECRPLFQSPEDLFKAVVALSPGFLVLPLAVTVWWRRRLEGPAAAAIAAFTVALPLCLVQRRFLLYLAVPSALALGASLKSMHANEVIQRIKLPGRGNLSWAVVLAVLSLMPITRGLMEMLSWPVEPSAALRGAIIDLEKNSPPAGPDNAAHGALEPSQHPRYGVVSAWDQSEQILALAKRPVVGSAFHSARAEAARAIAHRVLFSSPDAATLEADSAGVSYLLLTNLVENGYAAAYRTTEEPRPIESLMGQLYYRHNQELGWVPVYASPETFVFEGCSISEAQVWKREAGKFHPLGPAP